MSAAPTSRAGAAIACVLLPPLGVWLLAGIGRAFWIAVGLTCLFFVPGIVWALVVLLRGGVTSATAAVVHSAGG